MEAEQHKLAAILSADVAGYTRLMAQDEAATVRRLTAYRDEIGLLVHQRRGRVVDTPGDNLLADFSSVSDAVRCAVEIQRVIAARNADDPPERKLQFRIGVHLGEVMLEGQRIYGDGVNIAARLESLAEPGGVCVSGTVYEQVYAKLAVGFEDLGEQSVKNVPHPLRVYRLHLGPQGAPAQAPAARDLALAGLPGSGVAVFVFPTVWVFYVAVVLEILFMISPFALYYYSAYGPSLNVLNRSPWTAWLTQFFLPHFSQTTSPVLNALPTAGGTLIFAGVALFAVGFVQVYWSKLRKKTAVVGGLYRWVRHPQYLALAILGLGTLLVWPRFLVLVAYVIMLCLYGSLARSEERQCLRRFGASYRTYMERTSMFLPGRIFRGWPRLLPPSGLPRFAATLALSAAVIAGTVGLGFALRDYSLTRVSALYEDDMAVISPAVLERNELEAALRVARRAPEVGDKLGALEPTAKLLVYVIPVEWQLADIPMRLEGEPGGHYTPAGFDRSLYKVLFTRALLHGPAQGEGIVARAWGREPLIVARVNTAAGEVTEIETPPSHVQWGDIPTPMF